ncbi:LacI family transcriptional regulator [Paenibacillus crassostreae]|uniref:LacI family transcriptional regulator n=2 Tax=Paenibacillus crassostreae TaxID=1763538 RepID=A0A167AR53_9BACL|nr:LacI family transcriptional regulator [Paenibacillus crassostreae]OAB71337.1 LacI family transcriptional regulator [Paenibacillus crassostreae]
MYLQGEEPVGIVDSNIESIQSTRQITLGYSQLGSESDWRRANTASVIESAKEAGITLLFENAEQSQEKQFEAIRSFIQQKVDVIAISPVVQSGWEPILLEVKQAGIPVIISDRSVNVSDSSLYVTFIGSDFYDEGRKAGKYLLDKMKDKPGPIGIVELQGTIDSSPTVDRKNGFREIIASRSDLKILKSRPANFTLEEGKRVMESFLEEQNNDIDVLFSHNDDMALGAIEAIEQVGLRPGIDIVIISVDGTRKSFEMMVEGKINAVVECNPLLGMNLMQAVKEIMGGKNLPKRIVLPESIYTQAVAEREVNNRKY